MATSMRPRTGTPTRTPGVVGRAKREHAEIQHIQLLWPKHPEDHFNFQWLGRAGKEQRIFGLQQRRRRLAIQRGKRSGCIKQGWWRWLGRPQVNQMARVQETTALGRNVLEVLIGEVWRVSMSPSNSHSSTYDLVDAPGAHRFICSAATRPHKPSFSEFTSPDEAGNGLLARGKDRRSECDAGNFWSGFERHNLLWRCRAGQNHCRRICDRL